jgi:hypothetical protein
LVMSPPAKNLGISGREIAYYPYVVVFGHCVVTGGLQSLQAFHRPTGSRLRRSPPSADSKYILVTVGLTANADVQILAASAISAAPKSTDSRSTALICGSPDRTGAERTRVPWSHGTLALVGSAVWTAVTGRNAASLR